VYGMSITDPCIDWDTTERLVLKMHQALEGLSAKARDRGSWETGS
jgi:phospho-2-dehydro-3-deoxyheptonate aldolase